MKRMLLNADFWGEWPSFLLLLATLLPAGPT